MDFLRQLKLARCVPPVWAASGHAQTIMGHLLPSPRLRTPLERVEVRLADGDRLVGFHRPDHGPLVVSLFHGLGGNTDGDYMQRTALVCESLGLPCVLYNHRGCGAGAGLAAGPYHSGRGEDIGEAIGVSRRLYPTRRHVAIGFSLSGNALLLLMAGLKGDSLPDGAIAVNAPIELGSTARLIASGLNRIYELRFVGLCRQAVDERFRSGLIADRVRIGRLASLKDVDDLYTAPAGGFTGSQDYYDRCSARPHVGKIRRPTVLLSTEDDPFVVGTLYRDLALSPHAHLHLEPHGGHMGYLTRESTPLGSNRWLDYALHEYLGAFRRHFAD